MKHIPGVDMSSGSLGQGLSVAVGMAAVGKYDKKDYRVYTLCGDGEIQEGQIWEAAMWAGFKKMDNLVVVVDNNNLQIDGAVDEVCSPYPIDKKFEAFNFHVINIDGNDFDPVSYTHLMHPYPICGIAYSLLKILCIHFLYFFHVLLPSIKKRTATNPRL